MVATARIAAAEIIPPYFQNVANVHPRIIHGSEDPREFAPWTASRSVQSFLQSLPVRPDTQTSVTISRHHQNC